MIHDSGAERQIAAVQIIEDGDFVEMGRKDWLLNMFLKNK